MDLTTNGVVILMLSSLLRRTRRNYLCLLRKIKNLKSQIMIHKRAVRRKQEKETGDQEKSRSDFLVIFRRAFNTKINLLLQF
jgi:hypothetical protein